MEEGGEVEEKRLLLGLGELWNKHGQRNIPSPFLNKVNCSSLVYKIIRSMPKRSPLLRDVGLHKQMYIHECLYSLRAICKEQLSQNIKCLSFLSAIFL